MVRHTLHTRGCCRRNYADLLAFQPLGCPQRPTGYGRKMPAKHVLVIDDDPAMREVIGGFLTERAFRVSTVADGREWRASSPGIRSIIILDLKLADENGLDLMRGLPAQTEAPVIVVTGHAKEEADRVIGLELGADDYVMKPFDGNDEGDCGARPGGAAADGGRHPAHPHEGEARALSLRRLDAGHPRPRTDRAKRRGGDAHGGRINLLAAFVQSPQRVLSREQLLAAQHPLRRLHERGEEVELDRGKHRHPDPAPKARGRGCPATRRLIDGARASPSCRLCILGAGRGALTGSAPSLPKRVMSSCSSAAIG